MALPCGKCHVALLEQNFFLVYFSANFAAENWSALGIFLHGSWHSATMALHSVLLDGKITHMTLSRKVVRIPTHPHKEKKLLIVMEALSDGYIIQFIISNLKQIYLFIIMLFNYFM